MTRTLSDCVSHVRFVLVFRQSNRVKGLSFHAKRPWILTSLHSGVIQLWDYRMGTLIDRFDEHEGPVRGVHFHTTQPLFVSGGDDYKVKVWNHKTRKCLFTLLGHLDYIRTVQFHNEHPWIVTSSDDQTIRIWNWQSRLCVSVLTGHNHYVMCAGFHPKEDLVVSASLDQTVRVWDISALRKKGASPGDDMMRLPPMNNDLFGAGDAIVKYVLEGHDRGVNWASFHPSLPLIVSGADDRQVKLWRMNDTKAWEVDTLRGHVNNVSCVLFHAKQDIIVSNSEDKTIQVWDMSKRLGVQTFRREHDRFWIMSVHPEINLIAAGHDSGMIVFKLERERPAYTVHGNTLYYVKDRYLRTFDFGTNRDNPVLSLRRANANGGGGGSSLPRMLSYNPAENAVIMTYDAGARGGGGGGEGGGSYEMYMIPSDGAQSDAEAKRGAGINAVFVARNRFAVLDKANNQIVVKNMRNEVSKKCPSPTPTTETIFYAGTGMLLCRGEEQIVLFDIQQRSVLAEISCPAVKYVSWSPDMSHVALMSKHAIIIANKKLGNASTIHETIRVKSGGWDESGVFVYSTLNHIKYCLPNGDHGIIKTLEQPVYVAKVVGTTVHCIDREGKTRQIEIDSTEYRFKVALLQRRYDQVLAMIRSNALCGQSIIAYLQKKGFPDVALHFVRDDKTRFELAIECGNIEVALETAQRIDEKDTWHTLGVEGLRQGNHQIVEFCYQKTKNFERLAFLYLITGNIEKLSKLLKIAEMRGDVMGRFQNSLYLGNVRERVKILTECGQQHLAYVCAKTHGLDEEAAELASSLGEDALPSLLPNAELIMPPPPILKEDNWPLLRVSKGYFDTMGAGGADEAEYMDAMEDAADAWGGDDLDLDLGVADGGDDDVDAVDELLGVEKGDEDGEGDDDDEGGWDDLDDLDLPADAAAVDDGASVGDVFVAPTPGVPPTQRWAEKSSIPGEHAAAGAFDSAARLLNRQLAAKSLVALKSSFVNQALGTHAYVPGLPGTTPVVVALDRNWSADVPVQKPTSPSTLHTVEDFEDQLKRAYKMTTEGKFSDALKAFLAILHGVPLLVTDSRKEAEEAMELVSILREYVLALRLEIARKAESDPKRAAELAAYFTHCKLQNIHASLSLRSAMSIFYKLKNLGTAASFCRRLLELNPPAKVATQARQVLAACEKSPTDAVELHYDARNPFVICAKTYTPIYRGSKSRVCSYCSASFVPAAEGELCPICEIGTVGGEASGLVTYWR